MTRSKRQEAKEAPKGKSQEPPEKFLLNKNLHHSNEWFLSRLTHHLYSEALPAGRQV
jgi:hypothetical protein